MLQSCEQTNPNFGAATAALAKLASAVEQLHNCTENPGDLVDALMSHVMLESARSPFSRIRDSIKDNLST